MTQDLTQVSEHLRKVIEAGRVDEAIEMVIALLSQLREKNTELELRVAKLLRHQFGRNSEKVDPGQLALFLSQLAEVPPGAASQHPEVELPRPSPKPRDRHGRKPLPAHLPREPVVHEPPEEEKRCARCGKPKKRIGEDRSDELEFVPGHFKVREHIRPKYACCDCEDGVVQAPAPDRVIDGGRPGPGLLAHVLLSKYKDHVPLHRLRGIYQRSGVSIAVSTLADWVGAGARAFEPIAQAIGKQALASHLLQTDDTGLRVLDPDHPHGIKRGHIWVYVGDHLWSAFHYTPDWKGEGPQGFLKGREGWIQADGYKGYDALFSREGATAIEVGCWSHARRGWVDALEGGDVRAAIAVKLVGKLFEVERAATEAKEDPDQRLLRRLRDSKPVLDQLARWVADVAKFEPPKSPLAKAAGYVINQWKPLNRFLEDGRLPIDNNASERALRAIALGRKNYLFAGSDVGAARAATLYTIIGTCALCGVEPWAYLADVLEKLASGWPNGRLAELLPPNWKAARAAESGPAPPAAEVAPASASPPAA